MNKVKFLSEQLLPGERKFVRDSLIQSLVVAFGIAGAAKRLRSVCFLTHHRGTSALKAYLQAAKNIQKLCCEICPLTGKRYLRAREHIANHPIVHTPRALVKQLYALGGFYMRKAHYLNKDITKRAIAQVEGFAKYQRYLIFRGLHWQH